MRRASIEYIAGRKAPWAVTFLPPIGDWWFHAFYKWEDAIKFADDIVSDPERAHFWLKQLMPCDHR